MNIHKRPTLTKDIDPEVLKKFYWDKKELVLCCSICGLSSKGSKTNLSERIAFFLRTGNAKNLENNIRIGRLDSDKQLTRQTLVNNYKNDAKTRGFFEKEIGPHFRFNSYLRQFANASNQTNNLTYGDLIDGWLKEDVKKKDPNYKSMIDKQFQYNQFQRDFHAAEKGKTQKDCINAWQLVRSIPGESTYENYLQYYKMLID